MDSFCSGAGTISNGYQYQSSNFAPASSSVMSSIPSTNVPRQFSQTIPTAGFNSQQAVSTNVECSNGGLSNTESNAAPQSLQLKKYVESQNIHTLHNIGAQIGAGMRLNVLRNGSPHGLSNGLANVALGFIGNNIQLSAPAASEGFQSPNPYSSSPKPLYQNLDRQHHQPRMPSNVHVFTIINAIHASSFIFHVVSFHCIYDCLELYFPPFIS